MLKKIIKNIPILGKALVKLRSKFCQGTIIFTTSEQYWIERYENNGNSGAGSYNQLAEFKGEVINAFVEENKVNTVLEFGCGDGNQLKYFNFPAYIGYDISPLIIEKCKITHKGDLSKCFYHINEYVDQTVDLSLSLDVIYHLIEDQTYHNYMKKLFEASHSFVIIYSADFENDVKYADHVRPRKFTKWVAEHKPEFEMIRKIPNKYPFEIGKELSTSFADFYIYKLKN